MLRDDVIAYEGQHQCNDGNSKGKLLVRLPVALGDTLNPAGEWLDLFSSQQFDATDTADYLYLRLFPNYTQENDVHGEGMLTNTFSSPAVYHHKTVRRGFKAEVTDRRMLVLNIIRSLVVNSATSSYTEYAPVKVVDYCLPEAGEAYTVRYGAIAIGSLPGTGRGYLAGNWEFTFKEANLRDV